MKKRVSIPARAMSRSEVLAMVRGLGSDLLFVPDVVDVLGDWGVSVADAKRALLELASDGKVELRIEGGLGRLTDAERAKCIEHRSAGTTYLLSWMRTL